MAFDYVLFDLDGTLTNPYEGISKCVQYALKSFGLEENDKNVLKSIIGPPLKESFMKIYGFSESDAVKAVNKYRERYFEKGVHENALISGVPETLSELQKNGKRLFLSTSKPAVLAKIILDDFNISRYFEFIGGADLAFGRDEKWQVIEHVFESCGIKDIEKAVIVGDRMHDIIGAKKTGISSIGIPGDFGSIEELTSHGADYICDSISDILPIIIA